MWRSPSGLGRPCHRHPVLAAAVGVGFAGYGVSLALFVLALRHIGAARTGAYFSIAPFVGAAISILFLGDKPTMSFGVAAVLMAIGVWLHLTERHEHLHRHEPRHYCEVVMLLVAAGA